MAAHRPGLRTLIDRAVGLYRRLDPAGAYALYALYVGLVGGLSAVAGLFLASHVATPAAARAGGVYAGIMPGIALMLAHPLATRRPLRECLAVGGSMLAGAAVGSLVAGTETIAQPLVVAIAFAAFYMRRWPEPWPGAGLLGLIAFLVVQILAPFSAIEAIRAGILPMVAGVTAGYWFMPRKAFSRGLVAAARRLRSVVPGLLRTDLSEPDVARQTVSEINTLLDQVSTAREQADRFNGANARHHLALVHAAAVVARVWENAAESIHRVEVAGDRLPASGKDAARSAEAAVATALDDGSEASRAEAGAAIARIDETVSATLAERRSIGAMAGGSDTALFALLNVELTLTHLLDAVARLDREIAAWAGGRA